MGTQKNQRQEDAERDKIMFNWPYDYLSFVELIKFDVDVLFKSQKKAKKK